MEMHRCVNSWVCCDGECMNCSANKITISNRTGEMGAETEYIDREKAKRTLVQDYAYAAASLLDEVPKADVAPVRHGRWICIRKGYGEYECSVCHGEDSDCSDYYGTHVVTEQDFCPHCGASMDLEVSNGKSETVWYAPQGDSE